MSDYLGTNQTRVLDPDDRNFEEVIYQKRKPPLSCEWNLDTRNVSQRNGKDINTIVPSGWAIVGDVKKDFLEDECMAADVLTSSSLAENTIKLIALDKGVETRKLIAWVNGWRILVQGSSSTDENNIITLPEPPTTGNRVDFVFLEVWRKLITTSDTTIYKYGNILYGGTNFSNDLIDPAVNIETSLRIQLQYRIRIVEDIDIENYPSGFDPNKVFVQGPLSSVATCTFNNFTQMDTDLGLWRGGAGDSAAQEILQTVDGYTYAIPMFAIHRRNNGEYDPDTGSNGTEKTLINYNNGIASDRPDDLYNNWIVPRDILDMRHRVTPQENYKEICNDAFRKLIKGQLTEKIEKTTLGEDHYGVLITQADAVSNVDKAGSDIIGEGDGARRVFSNAAVTQPETFAVRTINDKTGGGTPGTPWAANDQVQINITSYPSGSVITSIDEAYIQSGPIDSTGFTDLTTVSALPTSNLILEVPTGSDLITTSDSFTLEYTVSYPSGPYGFTEVPDNMLEVRKEDSTVSIASQDMDIRVRIDSTQIVTNDGTKYSTLHNALGNITEPWDFGHQMIYHKTGPSTTFSRTISDYNILGVARARINSADATIVTVSRTASQYTVSLDPAPGADDDLEFTLYTDNKFFQTNKQGRAIIDCFEMRELTPVEPANGIRTDFHIDSTNQAILAIASQDIRDEGKGVAWIDGSMATLLTDNVTLPLDSTKTRVEIAFNGAPSNGANIEVPVLMRSAIGASEGYTFFYERTPYQGMIDASSWVTGKIEAEGPTITTTSGSGAITDYTYSTGTAEFTGTTTVRGVGTEWTSYAKAGYLIRANSDASKEYTIDSIYDDDTLFVTAATDASSSPGGEAYTIIAKDQPFYNHRNIIDRLPILDNQNDASGKSESISTAITDGYPVLDTRIISRVQDILDTSANSAQIGQNTADRGRSTIDVNGPIALGNLGLKFERLNVWGDYQKTYQSYILNKDNEGSLYLMVVGTETDSTSPSRYLNQGSSSDTVDIFQLPGRPLTNRKTE